MTDVGTTRRNSFSNSLLRCRATRWLSAVSSAGRRHFPTGPSWACHFRLLALLACAGISPRVHAAVPAAPSHCYAAAVSASATKATVEIGWDDNSTNETTWKIQYTTNDWATSSEIPLNASSTTTATKSISYTWSLAALNMTYRFRMVAANTSGSSAASNVATVGTFALAAPGNLIVTAVDPFNVSMSWEEASTSEAGFAIERKIGAGPWESLGSIGANALAVAPSSLLHPLESYSFRIRAFKGSTPSTPDLPAGANLSAYSNTVTLNSGAYTVTASAVPSQLTVNLSWPSIRNATKYRILYKEATETLYSNLGFVAANVTTYPVVFPASEAGKTYFFIVQPYLNDGNLGDSSAASATVDVPANMTSKSGASGIPGSPLSHTFTHVSNATVSSRTLTGIPTGLAFNSTTAVLSGVLPAVGNYTLNYTVHFTSGSSLTQRFFIRVRPPAGPPVAGTLIPAWNGMVGSTRDTPLAGAFTDPEAESAVRVSTTLGDMDFILFNTATPATVTNFMSYVNAGKYTSVAFHRSVDGFVIQGGGFKGAGSGGNFTSVVTLPPVVNEPGIANERGTLSMAKVGGDPNSATSQFFVSLGDNRANLDYQNEGFTVFGRVAGNGMVVADAISHLPRGTYNLFLDGSATATSFGDFPMNAAASPASMDQTKLVKMNSVATIPTLSYSITGNTVPTVATAGIVNGQLHLIGLAAGQTTITVAATDLDNHTATQTVAVELTENSKIPATVTLGSLTATYNGTAKSAKATTKPAKLAVNITYNGSATAPVNAGSYGVVATINDATYQGSATGTLVISKAVAKAKLGNLAAPYNGTAKSATAVTTPAGLAVDFTYGGLATPPTNAGSYAVVGTINNTNYQGKASGTLVISKATATLIPGSLAVAYDGTAKAATAVTTPPGLAVSFTYKGSVTAPANVGSYAVVGTINDTNYQGKASATLVISKATATARLGNLTATYDGTAKPVTATTTPAGLPMKFTYSGSATVPKNAGTYTVVATVNHANYQGGATATLVISKATATVVLGNLTATYSGTAKSATATTTPAKLALKFTYDGLAAAPKNIGSYAVVATINNPNYQGSATGNLVISAPSAKTVASADALSPAVAYTNQQAAAGGTPPSYATWAANLEISNGLAAGVLSNHADADFDCDGRSNLMEYAFGASPVVANDPAPGMPVAQTTATHFVLQYQRDTALTDLTFTAQACSDLAAWTSPGDAAAPIGFTDDLISTSGTLETRQAKIPRPSAGNVFIRIRVTRP